MVDCYYNCDMLRTINGYLALSGDLDDVNITPKSQYLHRVTYGLMQKYIRTHKEKKLKKMFFKRLSQKIGWIHLTYNQTNTDDIFFFFFSLIIYLYTKFVINLFMINHD